MARPLLFVRANSPGETHRTLSIGVDGKALRSVSGDVISANVQHERFGHAGRVPFVGRAIVAGASAGHDTSRTIDDIIEAGDVQRQRPFIGAANTSSRQHRRSQSLRR